MRLPVFFFDRAGPNPSGIGDSCTIPAREVQEWLGETRRSDQNVRYGDTRLAPPPLSVMDAALGLSSG